MNKDQTAEYLANKLQNDRFPDLTEYQEDSEYDQTVVQLWSSFAYEFSYWCSTVGFVPTELLESADYSESYEQDSMKVFELAGNRYATVSECGCSCYDPSWASIELHKTWEDAVDTFREYCRISENRNV